MATEEVTVEIDGEKITLEVPEGTTDEQIFKFLQQNHSAPAKPPTDGGFPGGRTMAQMAGGGIGAALAAPYGGPPSMYAGGALGSQTAGLLWDTLFEETVASVPQMAMEGAAEMALGPLVERGIQAATAGANQGARWTNSNMGRLWNRTAEAVDSAMTNPAVRERGQTLRANYPDIPLMPGQQSGGKARLMMENWLRQHPGSADIMAYQDRYATEQLARYLEDAATNTGGVSASADDLGRLLQDMTESRSNDLQDFASSSWRALTSGIDQATPDGAIPSTSFTSTLDEMIAQYSRRDTPKSRAITEQLVEMRNNANQGNMTFEQWHSRYSDYSAKSAGEGSIFTIREARPESRFIAGRLARALDRDLDNVTLPFQVDGVESRDLARTARELYRRVQQSRTRLDNSILGKNVGEELNDLAFGTGTARTTAGQKVIDQIFNPKTSVNEVRYVARVIGDTDEQLLRDVQRMAIDRALTAARRMPPSSGIQAPALSTSKLIKEMPEAEVLQALGMDANAIRELSDLQEIALRLGDRTGFNWSGTNAAGDVGEAVASGQRGASGLLGGRVGDALSAISTPIAKFLGARNAAIDLLDPAIRQDVLNQLYLRGLTDPPARTSARGAVLAPGVRAVGEQVSSN